MKVIEALKKIKYNNLKVADLTAKIAENSANMESEGSKYKDSKAKVAEWTQSIYDTNKDSNDLLIRVQKTNLVTVLAVEIAGKVVNKTVAEWINRRRVFVDLEAAAYRGMTSRRLQQKAVKNDKGEIVIDNVVYNFDPEVRDAALDILSQEKYLIDSALEISNAVTDLVN